MKKFTYLATALLVLAGVASCKKNADVQEPEQQSSGRMIPFTVTAGQGGQKTSIGDALGTLVWDSGDQITVLQQDGEYPTTLTLKGEGGAASGEFDGEISEDVENGAQLYGLYGVTYSYGKYSANIPASQTYTEGSFMPGAFPSIGSGQYVKNGATTLTFSTNPMGILRVTVKGASDERLTSVSLKSFNSSKKLAGSFTLEAGTWTVTGGTGDVITMNCGDIELSSEGVQLNFVVPPFTFASGELRVQATVNKNGTAGKLYTETNSSEVAITTNNVTNIERTIVLVQDVQNKWYDVCKIGDQTWMAENLKCSQYDTESEYSGTISTATSAVYTPYYIDVTDKTKWDLTTYSGNLKSAQIAKLGYLYNWAAAVGVADGQQQTAVFTVNRQGICPNGWHVPSQTEWNNLRTYIEGVKGSYTAGTNLKTTSGWYSGKGQKTGSDAYGFAALPADGSYGGIKADIVGYDALLWTATLKGSYDAYNCKMEYDATRLYSDNGVKSNAQSVRCLKD